MDSLCKSEALERGNTHRTLSWRWERAQAIVATGRRLSSRRDDPATMTLVHYLRHQARHRPARARSSSRSLWLTIDAARRLMEQGEAKRSELEARILAGQSDEEIANRLSLPAETVRWFEATLFNVRDRLEVRDWIVVRAIGPGIWSGCSDVGSIWKTVAYFGGPTVLDAVIAVTTATHPPCTDERLRESVELLILSLRLPPNTPLPQLAELYAQVRQQELARRSTTVAAQVAEQSNRLLDEALAEPAETTPTVPLLSSVA